jgi:hypothetical protein
MLVQSKRAVLPKQLAKHSADVPQILLQSKQKAADTQLPHTDRAAVRHNRQAQLRYSHFAGSRKEDKAWGTMHNAKSWQRVMSKGSSTSSNDHHRCVLHCTRLHIPLPPLLQGLLQAGALHAVR